MMGNLATLLRRPRAKWPACAGDLTDEVAIGLRLSRVALQPPHRGGRRGAADRGQRGRWAAAFEQVDFIIAATNPGPAFPADAATSSSDDSFLDWAKSSDVARYVFRGVLFGVRLAASALRRSCPSTLLESGQQAASPTS